MNRLLHITTATVHTTSLSFLETLHCLAAEPQYAHVLQEEITSCTRDVEGFTKQAFIHMSKLDSFMTETSRWCSLSGRVSQKCMVTAISELTRLCSSVKLARLALKDWQLSDGTQIPKGTLMFQNEKPMYLDAAIYEDPDQFDPFPRHHRRQQDDEANKHQYVMTSSKHLHFGHGKHACPGGFFASNDIKVLMALVTMRYDIRLTNVPGGLDEVWHGYRRKLMRVPLRNIKVKFRDRFSQIPSDISNHFISI